MKKYIYSLLILLVTVVLAQAQVHYIATAIAGGGNGNGLPATAVSWEADCVAVDDSGNTFVPDVYHNLVLKINKKGIVGIVAGTSGYKGHTGDGGYAKKATLFFEGGESINVDKFGNIYFSENGNDDIRKIDAKGIITTIAGNGTPGWNGDNKPATAAEVNGPVDLYTDSVGDLFFNDRWNYRIREIDTSGIITTIMGPFTSSNYISAIALDHSSNLYYAYTDSNVVYKGNGTKGVKVAGKQGLNTYSGDGGPATAAGLAAINYICIDYAGNVYIDDAADNSVRKVTSSTGIINRVAGENLGFGGYNGDGIMATKAMLNSPENIAIDNIANLYITDVSSDRLRKVDTSGIIHTVLGNGHINYTGDSLPALQVEFQSVRGFFVDSNGDVFFADNGNHEIRKLSTSGLVTRIAGNGEQTSIGADSGKADTMGLYLFDNSCNMSVDKAGDLLFADGIGYLRKINQAGIMTTIAGNQPSSTATGFTGDGGPATAAAFQSAINTEVDDSGNIYVADYCAGRIRKINTQGIISTYAGSGTYTYCAGSFTGDAGPATAATFNRICAITRDKGNNFYVMDGGNDRIRKISSNGIVTTIAGTGIQGFSGDGGPATAAQLEDPWDMTIDSIGNLYITDFRYIRKIDTSGIITTIAGTGLNGDSTRNGMGFYYGNTGLADTINFDSPFGIGCDLKTGNLYVGDQNFIWKLTPYTQIPTNIQPVLAGTFNVTCFPNPFTNFTTIQFSNGGKHSLELDDITGRTLMNIECTGKQYILRPGKLAEGIYFIKAYDQTLNCSSTVKVVIN